jgi:ketosteroid isomerase-like protein
VPSNALAVLPEQVDVARGAALPLAGLTALRLLRASGAVAGLRVLLTGASGGVGHYLTELAAATGASVTAVSASPERAERLLALGATDVAQNLDDATGPYDVAFESVGGSSVPHTLKPLAKGGRLIWLGQASRMPSQLDFFDFFARTGATIRHFDHEDSTVPDSRDLATLVRLVAGDRLRPEIGVVAHWTQTASVLEDLRERRIRGNAVLRIDHASHPPSQIRRSEMIEPIDTKTVAQRYVSAAEAGEKHAIRDLFAHDATWTLAGDLPISGVWEGRDSIVDEFLATAMSYYEPGSISLKITGMIAEHDQVVLQWTSRARTRDGRPYENGCIGVFTIRDGQIQAVREYMDTLYAHEVAFSDHATLRPAVVGGE